ncbi:MAG TPA: secretin and TonB N-terminal domain-containing protein, partial [Nitrosomonas europaea]|uniref:STN domain-containing protein n=2 Tax=Nitrosomonas europaea TaxID=915 RepID=UPI002CEB71FB
MLRSGLFLAVVMLASPIVQAQISATQQQPALPLAAALQQLAVRHNLSIVFDAEIVKGKQASPLSEDLSIREALDTLLNGSGLQAKEIAPGRYSIVKATTGAMQQTLPEMTVTGAPDPDSPYSTQYRVPEATTATKTQTPIMETPMSIQVVPKSVMNDQQAITL